MSKKLKPVTKKKIERLAQGKPMYWDDPILVIDRSYLPKCGTSRIPLKDTDPEVVLKTVLQIAAVLKPPEAIWYVEPAKPHRLSKARRDTS